MLLPDADTWAAVWVTNRITQPYTLTAGVEVGQANMVNALMGSEDPGRVSPSTTRHVDVPSNKIAFEEFSHLQPVIDSLPAELSVTEREEAISFIQQNSRVFSKGEFDFGRKTLITHHIDTGDAKPIRQGLRRHPQVYMDVIDREVAKMEAA